MPVLPPLLEGAVGASPGLRKAVAKLEEQLLKARDAGKAHTIAEVMQQADEPKLNRAMMAAYNRVRTLTDALLLRPADTQEEQDAVSLAYLRTHALRRGPAADRWIAGYGCGGPAPRFGAASRAVLK